jgi:hypothetical protein
MALRAPSRSARRSATVAGRPRLHVVAGKGKRRWSPVPVVVLVVMAVFGVSALQATMSQDGLKAAKLEREVAQETERTTLLRARVAQLSNPGRVADEAEKLGLVGAPTPKHLKVATDHPEALRRHDRAPDASAGTP